MQIHLGEHCLARGQAYDESPRALHVESTRQSQTVHLLQAPFARYADRANTDTLIRFRIQRRHATPDDALRFALTHASTLRDPAPTATFQLEDTPTTLTLHNATLRHLHLTHEGHLTLADYTLAGGQLTQHP